MTESSFAEMFNQGIETIMPRVHQMGIEAIELEPGFVRAKAPLEGNENHIGSVYAGTLFILAELLGGALFLSSFDASKFYPVVKDVQIRFVRPARGDVVAESRIAADELERLRELAATKGKAEFVLTVAITDGDGQTVATTTGTYQARSHGS